MARKIEFSGKASGKALLRLSDESAWLTAALILGVPAKELNDEAEVNDTIGEPLSICTGNFKSTLCDASLNCELHPPLAMRTSESDIETLPGGGLERMVAPDIQLFVNMTDTPFNE